MDLDALQSKVQDLIERDKKIRHQKAEILGALSAKKQELANLVKEITDAGFDPKTIRDVYAATVKELEELVVKYTADIEKAESSLQEFNKSK